MVVVVGQRQLDIDVCVIGAGLAGLTVARDPIGYPYTGSLDEIAIYPYALTAAQVSAALCAIRGDHSRR